MKNKVMWMVIAWVLVAGVLWTVSAYSTQIWSPIQFVKQLFVTPQGQIDQSKATIKLDGTNWTISAKNIEVSWQDVATKNYVDNKLKKIIDAQKVTNTKARPTLSSAKSIKNNHSNSKVTSVCNASHVRRRNKNGNTCTKLNVTNNIHCINAKQDNTIFGEEPHKTRCRNSALRREDTYKGEFEGWTDITYPPVWRKSLYVRK